MIVHKVTAFMEKCRNFVHMNRMQQRSERFLMPRRTPRLYRQVLQQAKSGELIKIKNGIYASWDSLARGMIEIDAIVPGGILCLFSAWRHYNLTLQIPDSFYIAIARKRKVRLPQTIDITLVYQSDPLLEIGRTSAVIDGIEVLIYDRERCVCDAIKYRNKIGIDVMSEILDNYLKRPDRDLNLLAAYARKLRVYKILSHYLEIKL